MSEEEKSNSSSEERAKLTKNKVSKKSGKNNKSNGLQVNQKIAFTGRAREYFGIWIINLIFSIMTFGIYSAWAKVRREKYFKNNTQILNTGFGYHASGGQIFKGRLIAFLILIFFSVVSSFQPMLGGIINLVFLFLIPWLLNSSMRFAARMTSFRNIRFNWLGTYWKTFWFLVIAPFVGLLTFGLITPLISKYYYSYLASSHCYGKTKFAANPKLKDYYFAFLVGGVLPAAILCGVYFIVSFLFFLLDGNNAFLYNPFHPNKIIMSLFITLYAFIFSMIFIYRVLCRNIMMKSLTISNIAKFNSTINPIQFIWISLTNLMVVIISIGLLLPWAKVRMYSYLADNTQINIDGDIEKFIDNSLASEASFGEEFAELEGVEVSI